MKGSIFIKTPKKKMEFEPGRDFEILIHSKTGRGMI